jgi:hypothetical protein
MESLENEGLLTNTSSKRTNKSYENGPKKKFLPFQICQRKNIFFVLMASPFMVILLVLNGSSGLSFLHQGQVWYKPAVSNRISSLATPLIIWTLKCEIYRVKIPKLDLNEHIKLKSIRILNAKV